jgi:hypothetical protein
MAPVRIATMLACAALACAGPASAAPEWHTGNSEQSQAGDCSFVLQPAIQANAFFQSDPVAIPRVGDVFYVRTVAGRIGEACGIDMLDHVEIVPPPGVTTAISPATPVRCNYMDINTGTLTPAAGCPQEDGEGIYGPAFDQLTPGGPTDSYPWKIDYGQALVIEIPLRSSRPLSGTAPTCVRYEGAPPCTADKSGDALQFTEKIIDGWSSPWLSPYVPLFVQPAAGGPGGGGGSGTGTKPGGGGTGGSHPGGSARLVRVSTSIKRARLLKGMPVTINVPKAGSGVSAQLFANGLRRASAARSVLVARKVVRNAGAGSLRLRLKPSRRVAAKLRVMRNGFGLTLKVRVTPPGAAASSAQVRIAVRP